MTSRLQFSHAHRLPNSARSPPPIYEVCLRSQPSYIVGAVLNTARVRPGDTVAIFGAGGVGLNAVTAASLAGATQIIAVDIHDAGYQKLADPEVSRVVITRF